MKKISVLFAMLAVVAMAFVTTGCKDGSDGQSMTELVVSQTANVSITNDEPTGNFSLVKKNADKITIMLTARIWETNILESNYKESKYYKMLKSIINNIPKEYKDKVYVLPHPLLLDKFKNTDITIPDILSYDKILEDTALLITDYSSIAYSAFYRGSNVIFCWEELDECMEKFESHLMLNDKNVFGDISYKYKDLPELIKKNYLKPQSAKYKNRYSKIVEFHDNKNTDRLIKCLKKDGII